VSSLEEEEEAEAPSQRMTEAAGSEPPELTPYTGMIPSGSASGAIPPRSLAFSEASEASDADGTETPNARTLTFGTPGAGGGAGQPVGSTSPPSGGLLAASARDSSDGTQTSGDGGGAAASSSDANSGDTVSARIVCTQNQLEEEPWLPVRSIVTMFRIQVSSGDRQWDVMRRYSDFHELHMQLAKASDPLTMPALPPKLLLNDDTSIAER
jgi:hypothetical protein